MAIDRRTFLGALPLAAAAPGHAAEPVTLEAAGAKAVIGPAGEVSSLVYRGTELVDRGLGPSFPRIVEGREELVCDRPVSSRRERRGIVLEYRFSGALRCSVTRGIELIEAVPGAPVLKQSIRVEAAPSAAYRLEMPLNIRLPGESRGVFVPLKNGIGRRKPVLGLDNDDEYAYRFAGGTGGGKTQILAIPMLDEYSGASAIRLTHLTDPLFSSYFRLPYRQTAGEFHCMANPAAKSRVLERTVCVGMHQADPRRAMDVFYSAVLADVQPAACWTHDIAMVDYDYLSENGRGWFADIDALTNLIPPADRGKVCLALHGWYDVVGRYCFDPKAKALDRKWIAFPLARDPDIQALGVERRRDPMSWPKASVEALRPVEMTTADMHRRIRYARDRGFRVLMYYADGMAAGDGIKELFDRSKLLRYGGWKGPDTRGRTYTQNPLHPEVRAFFRGYTEALLEEYGKVVDGFVWDETFYIREGELGNDAYPGHADRAYMTLLREMAGLVAGFDPRLVLMASDCIGARFMTSIPPYALMAHGTYQDSHCRPEAWPYGLFPNFRNVLWSCNWAPVTNFRFTKYGVETFDTPVAISNGSFGDDTGISEMTSEQRRGIMALFDSRKKRRMQIGWVEEAGGSPAYLGRPVLYRYSL